MYLLHIIFLRFLARHLPYITGMGRPLRYMPEPHTLFEVTSRTMQGRFLLRPSRQLNELILGIIGRAMRKYPVRLYLFVVLSNHMHLIVSAPNTKTLADFMCYIKGNIAKEAGRLHRWREKFWGRRYAAIAILDDDSLMARVNYLLANGCKEGLVARPGDWPGVHCVDALTKGRPLVGRWVDRTLQYEAGRDEGKDLNKFSTLYEVPLSTLPCFEGWSTKEQRSKWQLLVGEIEAETRRRLEQEQVTALGPRRIMALDPHDHPAQPNHTPQPFCHAVEKSAVKFFRKAYDLFVDAYRQAQDLLTRGDPRSLSMFPDDCYLPPLALSLSPTAFSSA